MTSTTKNASSVPPMDQEIVAEELSEEQLNASDCASTVGTVASVGSCVGTVGTYSSVISCGEQQLK